MKESVKWIKEILFESSYLDVLPLFHVVIFLSPGLIIVYLYHWSIINQLNIVSQYILVIIISILIYYSLVFTTSLRYVEIKNEPDFLSPIQVREKSKKYLVILRFQALVSILLITFFSITHFELISKDFLLVLLAISIVSINSIWKMIKVGYLIVKVKIFKKIKITKNKFKEKCLDFVNSFFENKK